MGSQTSFWEQVVAPYFSLDGPRTLSALQCLELVPSKVDDACCDNPSSCQCLARLSFADRVSALVRTSQPTDLLFRGWSQAVSRVASHDTDPRMSSLPTAPELIIDDAYGPGHRSVIRKRNEATVLLLLQGPNGATACADLSLTSSLEASVADLLDYNLRASPPVDAFLTTCAPQLAAELVSWRSLPSACTRNRTVKSSEYLSSVFEADANELSCALQCIQNDLSLQQSASDKRLSCLLARIQASGQGDSAMGARGLRIDDKCISRLVRREPSLTDCLSGSLAYRVSRSPCSTSISLPLPIGVNVTQHDRHLSISNSSPEFSTTKEPVLTARARAPFTADARLIETQSNMTIFRTLALSMMAGIRDQTPGFSLQRDDSHHAIPASWLLDVEGRRIPPLSAEPQPVIETDGIDAPSVCAVCFDWHAHEGNELVYCDRCNLAVHRFLRDRMCVRECAASYW
jgi:hypothetical protein